MSLRELNIVDIECSISLWYEQFKSVDVFTQLHHHKKIKFSIFFLFLFLFASPMISCGELYNQNQCKINIISLSLSFLLSLRYFNSLGVERNSNKFALIITLTLFFPQSIRIRTIFISKSIFYALFLLIYWNHLFQQVNKNQIRFRFLISNFESI